MVQWVKELTIKSGNLSLIPRTYTVEGENQFPLSVPRFLLAHRSMCMQVCTHTIEIDTDADIDRQTDT